MSMPLDQDAMDLERALLLAKNATEKWAQHEAAYVPGGGFKSEELMSAERQLQTIMRRREKLAARLV